MVKNKIKEFFINNDIYDILFMLLLIIDTILFFFMTAYIYGMYNEAEKLTDYFINYVGLG